MIIKSGYKFVAGIRPIPFQYRKINIKKDYTNLPYLKHHAAKNRCSLHDYKLNMKDISRRAIPRWTYTLLELDILLSIKYRMLQRKWGRTMSERSNMCEDITLNRKDAGTTIRLKF